MDPLWRETLEGCAADTDASGGIRFDELASEQRAARDTNVIAPLAHLGLILASGPDTHKFLQGQLTNDVNALDPASGQLSAYCSPKGRVLAILELALADAQGIWLSLAAELVAPTLERLRKYVLMSKTNLRSASEERLQIGVAGPAAEELIGRLVTEVPARNYATARTAALTVMRVPGLSSRFIVACPRDAAPAIWRTLAQDAVTVGTRAWRWLDIGAGLPSITNATADSFVPQMLNLQALGALSFSKGCYTGQEIVARTHYLGRLKRRMFGAHIARAEPPAPGEPVFAAQRDAAVGSVAAAEPAPEGGCDLLVVVPIEANERVDLRLDPARSIELTLRELPYPVEIPTAADKS